MKLHGITIAGMHNTEHETYRFSNFTYLTGQNGAGKSTILQAIQLALLGYIPGTGKTKSDIAGHSSAAETSIELDFGATLIGWNLRKSGKGVTIESDASQDDIDAILGNLKLPVFSFSEFTDMSSNKLKDWFIDFLPSDSTTIDWKITICKALAAAGISMESPDVEQLISELAFRASDCADTPLEQVRGFNAYLKDYLSIAKAEILRIQKTIESLVYYDDTLDVLDTPETIKQKIDALQNDLVELKSKISVIRYSKDAVCRYVKLIECCGLEYDSLPDDLESSLEYQNMCDKLSCYQRDIEYYTDKLNGYAARLAEIKYRMSQYNSIIAAPDRCPYCDITCSSLDATRERAQEQLVSLQEELDELNSQMDEISNLRKIAMQHQIELARRIDDYKKAVTVYRPAIIKEKRYADIDMSEIELNIGETSAAISELTDLLAKIKANRQYSELSDTIMKDKMLAETRAEVLKVLAKLTDVNGMQTSIMERPFIEFSDEISEIYSEIMNDESKFVFNLESKANSFGFGIIRDGKYIGFDYLSSGEKSLVTLSLLVGIVLKSNAKLKILLIDDMLDHLDAERSALCFDALYKLCEAHDIQIIAAGVIPCDHPKASEFTIHVGDT